MPFGAIITSGENNTPLPDSIAQWLTEVRVEQELSETTKFAIRFEDDLCGDEPAVAGAEEIRANAMLAVLVPSGNEVICLARGRVTRVQSSSQLGGPGSWVEAHCEGRQVEMDRETVQANWTGEEAQIITSALAGYDFTPDVANVQQKTYSTTEQLNQRGTDLAFLNKIASENGVDFWITYEVGPTNPLTADTPITETAHFRISPEVPEGSPFDIGEFQLTPATEKPSFRVNVSGDSCPNVNSFDAEVDNERPNQATGAAIDAASGETADTSSTPDPATTGDGVTVDGLDGVARTIIPSGPGNSGDQQRRQDAALREASWFVEASVSTSTHMLGAVLQPHDLINVEGAGLRLSIPYQVKSVIHVNNGADHMMDVKLRSNIIGEDG